MNKLSFLALVFAVAFFGCQQSGNKKTDEKVDGNLVQNPATISGDTTNQKVAEIVFETTEHDFGKIKEGDKVTYDFRFTNTGDVPLLISAVKASCGCTTPEWPKELIQPGASDKIKVQYNSKGREGEFNKGIVITANTYPNTQTIKISGVVFK
ncbi:MAG: DUF1573 domain-containing protein [Chitinophagaceae bacterium]|nr:DUF1573 domain-containing protein [Chitinophagaceae bacterium]